MVIMHLYPWPVVSKVPVENISMIDKVLKNNLENLITLNTRLYEKGVEVSQEDRGPYTLYSENDFQNLIYLSYEI